MHGFHYNPDAGNAQVDMGMFPENERAYEATDEGEGGGDGGNADKCQHDMRAMRKPRWHHAGMVLFSGGGMPSYGWIRVQGRSAVNGEMTMMPFFTAMRHPFGYSPYLSNRMPPSMNDTLLACL